MLSTDRPLRVALASTNRAKLAAVRAIAARLFPQADLQAVAVAVEVPAQPIGDDQTQDGAIARARAVAALTGADLALGLEGGLRNTRVGWALCSWAAAVDAGGRLGLGCGGVLPLPPAVVERVLNGEELGLVMDHLVQQTQTRHGPGAFGILTSGLLDRQHSFEDALTCALAPWLRPALWSPEASSEDR